MSGYLLLGCHRGEESKDAILSVLKSRVANLCEEVCRFDVPENLKFGSFDSLIAMMDDLAKHDSSCEGVIRRIERQMTELDSKAEFKILFRQKTMTVESYVRSFTWDETKWPRNRSLADNLQTLMTVMTRIDEDVKNKAYQYTDAKQALTNANKTKGAGLSLATADLVEILTPQVVVPGDFIEKEHMTTVLVVVQDQNEKDFLASYESMHDFVVPKSAKKFEKIENGKVSPIVDKDGNVLYRVVMFKKAVEDFTTACKAKKCTVRTNFTYSPEAYKEQMAYNEGLHTELSKQELSLKRHCAAAFSDAIVAWMHLKAMRVFVEAILRYGVPPNFAAFIVKPVKAKNTTKLRGVLGEVFRASGLFGNSYIGSAAAADDDDTYYPYVSLNLQVLSDAKAQ